MSRVPEWLGRLGAGLTEMSERLDERRVQIEQDQAEAGPAASASAPEQEAAPVPRPVPVPVPVVPVPDTDHPADADPRYADPRDAEPADAVTAPDAELPSPKRQQPAPPPTPVAVPVSVPVPVMQMIRPDPAHAVPWGVRVAAEAGWRLLVLAGTVWVLMRVISAVQLVVLAFVAAMLITALMQPTVSRLTRRGVPRGVATALTAILGFVIMGLIGWFVTWQVMENIDNLSNQVQGGIDDLRKWLLNSPLHVTNKQINGIAKNLRDAIGANTDQITSAGLAGVQVVVEAMTGILLTFFSTLFLLYDGRRIWEWSLKLVPAQARPALAGAGPRAWRTLTAYVRGTVIVALIDAIFIGLGIYFLDVPMAVPLAVFIFLFSFIPLVGAVASGALAVVVALVTQGVFTAVMTLAVVLAVQQIEGHILQPFILGRAVRVHPLAVVLSVAAGGMIAGIGGAVVAVPLVAVTNTVVGYLRSYAQEEAALAAQLDEEPPEIETAPTGGTPSRDAGAMDPV
ncbi:AI-2E family transporter [Streptomyces sp. YIM S03343]